ncbi:hypothetical protein L6164_008392 [Bauhinia variegata]|uniref:Uncharacterized protein n=1 Tax=Bauhinia variegata TaxID=167791 RepID=A0ACB9PGL6_BAUVA|nr:hypothetical protein L6164_008392 [Bauhinia variegata]
MILQCNIKVGLEAFCCSPRAQQSYKRLSPGRDQQSHDSFHWKSINTMTSSSLTHHCFPSNKIPQPFPLCLDELKRIDHDVSHPMVQQMVNPEKLHLCSFCRMQRGVTQHPPTYQVTPCAQKLAPMQYCTSGYQEPIYQGFIKENLGSPAERKNNHAVVDDILDIKPSAGHWCPYPYGRGFW